MYLVSKQLRFSAAHQVRECGGDCERMHGHNWRVVAFVGAEQLDALGMVIDFKLLKQALKAIVAPLDHQLLADVPPFDTINPTSENLARHIFNALAQRLDDARIAVQRVDVWETEESCATYRRSGQ